MAELFDIGIFSVEDIDGNVGVGWHLNFYRTGTTERQDTYPTEADANAGTNPNTNPVVANADGRFPPIWLKTTGDAYKAVLTTDEDVVQTTRDPAIYSISRELASTAPGDGGDRVGFIQSGSGATPRTMQDKERDTVSVKDFGAKGDATFVTNGGTYTGTDDTVAFQKALATGKNVFVPDGKYLISDTIAVKFDGQHLFGEGTYTTQLIWTANEPTKNFVELYTGRQDGSPGATKTNMAASGFMQSSAAGSAMNCAIWVEAGNFHGRIAHIRWVYFWGSVAGAFLKMDSQGGTSYSPGMEVMDCVGTGIANGTGNAIPIGIWVESAIEHLYVQVKIFSTGDGWVIGRENGTFDNNENCTFIRCHGEIGDRGYGRDDGAALRICQGSNLNFYSCKFTGGINDQPSMTDVTNQVSIAFQSPDSSKPFRGINFHGCNVWQLSNPVVQARRPVAFHSACVGRDVGFYGTRVNAVTGFIDNAADIDVKIERTCYEAVLPSVSGVSFEGRMGVTATPTSMAADTTQTVAGPVEYSAFGLPVQVSSGLSLGGVHLSWYHTTSTGLNVFALYNPVGGATNAFGSGRRFALRHYQPADIRARVCKNWDPVSYGKNAGQTTTISCPGARVGDFVSAGFVAPASGGMDNHIICAWVSANDVISVRLFNPKGTKNFGIGRLTAYLLAPNFDFIGSAVYAPPSMPTLTVAATTVSVPGASLGDFVEVSFSNDLQGVFLWGEVTSADTVTVRLFNSTAATVALTSGTLTVGVRQRSLSL